jgi:hypothetical protein
MGRLEKAMEDLKSRYVLTAEDLNIDWSPFVTHAAGVRK